MRSLSSALIFELFWLCGAFGQCWVVREGEAVGKILVPEGSSERVVKASDELLHYIGAMSGARPLITSNFDEAGRNTLFLLTESIAEARGISAGALEGRSPEAFTLSVQGGRAYLIGQTDLAVQHGTSWLLEQWGCRWLFPGKAGEVVPQRPNVTITRSMETIQEPWALMRRIWYGWGGRMPKDVQQAYRNWLRRNRLEGSLTGSIGHSYHNFVSTRDEELFKEHPEYFPLINGKRVRRGQVCTSNLDVRRRAVDYALRFFKRHPEAVMVSMSPNDGGGVCQCENCRAIGSFSDQALTLANIVADALKKNKATRDKFVAMYAYYVTSEPPRVRARDNVIIFVATAYTRGRDWRELLLGWSKKAKRLGIRTYASVLPWSWTTPVWGIEKMVEDIRFWKEHKVVAVSVESGNDWGGWGLYHYVMGKLLWDAHLDPDSIINDYIEEGFGKAGIAMRSYFERWRRPYTNNTLALALRDVKRSLQLAQTENVRRRVLQFALYLHHLRLFYELNKTPPRDKQELERRGKRLVGFDWRLIPTNMAHTLPLIDVYIKPDLARRLGVKRKVIDGWKSSEPLEEEEAMKMLEEDIEALKPLKVERRAFPVPPKLVELKGTTPRPNFRGVNYFILLPKGGEAEVTLSSGLPSRSPAIDVSLWQLKQALTDGDLAKWISTKPEPDFHKTLQPQDGSPVRVSLPVTEGKTYLLRLNDHRGGCRVCFEGVGAYLVASEHLPFHTIYGTHGRLAFWIPQGTVRFGIGITTSDRWGRVTVYGPDGKQIIQREGNFVLPEELELRVPRGKDGKWWSFSLTRGEDFDRTYLIGIPPYIYLPEERKAGSP